MDNQERIAQRLLATHRRLVTAESCTAGGVAFMLTTVPGSSVWFDRGFITYCDDAKHSMLGVSRALLNTVGAVSEAVAIAMAEGALQASGQHVAVSVTGIAGPDGGTFKTPVGTVWFAMAERGRPSFSWHHLFKGDRNTIRQQAIESVLAQLVASL